MTSPSAPRSAKRKSAPKASSTNSSQQEDDSAVKRGQGRPDQDLKVGRQAILAAARERLRVHPSAAVTIKDVAELAGVDAALVRYYFGNKEGLLTAAVTEMMAERQARSRALLDKDWTPERRLRERLANILGQQIDEPNFHRLVVEQLFSAEGKEAQHAVEAIAARGLALEIDFLQRSQPALRSVDPRFLNICLLGLCEFFASSQPLVGALFGGRPVDEKLAEQYLDFAVDLLLNGLRSR